MYGTETVSRSEQSMERIEQISSWLKEKNISSAFIHSKENVFYLTGFYTEPHERLMGVFIFQDEEPFFVCPQMEAGQARAAGWAYEIIGYGDHQNPWELISSALQKRNGQCLKVAVEKETLALSRAEMLQAVTNGAEPCLCRRKAEPNPRHQRRKRNQHPPRSGQACRLRGRSRSRRIKRGDSGNRCRR